MEQTSYILLGLRLVLVVTLYAFLGIIVKNLLKDITVHTQWLERRAAPSISLFSQEQSHRFTSDEILLGRSPSNDFCIQDETVSATHLRIYHQQNQWWAEDTGSSNGSSINGIMLETATVLTDGDQLQLGKFIVGIRFNTDEPGD